MNILKDRINQVENAKANIEQKVQEEHIIPTEQEQETVMDITKKISDRFAGELVRNKNDLSAIQEDLTAAIQEECEKQNISFEEQKRIEKTVITRIMGQGPIEVYLQDPSVTEIVVQRYDNIVIERNGRIEKADAQFASEEDLRASIDRIVQGSGRQINLTNPIADARLPDGSRVNAAIPPVAVDGSTITIRKFNKHYLTGDDYVNAGSLNREMLYFLAQCVRGRQTIFVSGGTDSGKTTLLNMLSSFIPEDELILTIEDTAELQLQQPNVRRYEVRTSTNSDMMQVDQQALVKMALRQRPDRIILGEARDGSIVDLFNALSTGHDGSMSTIHANSPRNLVDNRIPLLFLQNSNINYSEKAINMLVAQVLQVIVQISRLPDGRRKITDISYIDGVNNNGIILKNVFSYDKKNDRFRKAQEPPTKIINDIKERGIEFRDSLFPDSDAKDESNAQKKQKAGR